MKRPAEKVAERVYEALTEPSVIYEGKRAWKFNAYADSMKPRILAAIERAIGEPEADAICDAARNDPMLGGRMGCLLKAGHEGDHFSKTGHYWWPQKRQRRPLADATPAKGRRGRRA